MKIGLLALWAGIALGQAPKVAFEAASIKPSDPAGTESFWRLSPGRLTIRNMSLKSIVMAVYKVKRYQVTGGSKWLDSDRFDVVANLAGDPGAPGARGPDAAARLIAAAQSMLVERFQLVFHHDTRLLPGYALAVAKGGPRLKPTAGDVSTIRTTRTSLKATGYSMEQFASSLSTELGEPVVDATGLAGAFDFELEWAQEEAGAALSDRPSFFTALQETLGLKLAAIKTPAAILVIDRAERPDAN